MLELCLDLNQCPSIPPELRFNVSLPRLQREPSIVSPDVTPEEAHAMLLKFQNAVAGGRMPPLDFHIMREQIDERLAAQGVPLLAELEEKVPHPTASSVDELPDELRSDDPPPIGYMTTEQEAEYLLRLDAKQGDDVALIRGAGAEKELAMDDRLGPELTSRELERHFEFLNPQSQHNWLKAHHNPNNPDMEDTESLASHTDVGHTSKAARKRASKNLARQVGDRAIERAREGFSPSAASAMEEDELALDDGMIGSGKKKARDQDGTFRLKGGKSGGTKSKRKRSGEDLMGGSVGGGGGVGGVGGGVKKPRIDNGE